jgi:hypothetical protein|tara:strand:+ start:194 stop:481 length:288 start_codon:yes stop_codon:yes gene_type:complete
MEKFLKVNVESAGGPTQLVSIKDLKLIEQPTTTTVTLAYGSGKVITLTWPNGESEPALLNSVQNAVKEALALGWTEVAVPYVPKKDGYLTGLAIA